MAGPADVSVLTYRGDFVEFVEAGSAAKGEFHCTQCGYGVTVYRELPVCPMCAGVLWEQSPWSPFVRTAPTR
jgi:hypothetical protein